MSPRSTEFMEAARRRLAAAETVLEDGKHPPRPRDPSQLGKLIVDIATGQAEDPDLDAGKDEKMATLGRKGGAAGGKTRAERLTAEERSDAAKQAAQARWAKQRA